MKKRILSVLLVVAMLASMVVMPVYADNTATQSANANSSEAVQAKTICPHCGVAYSEIKDWISINESNYNYTTGLDLATDDGHYRLTSDITVTSSHGVYMTTDSIEAVFDFNGYKIITPNKRAFMTGYIATNNYVRNCVLYIVDSSAKQTGGVSTTATTMGGPCVYVYNKVKIYGGTFTGSANCTATGGVLYNNGGEMSVYGGTFDASPIKNTASSKNGGAMYSTGSTYIYGGEFIGGEQTGYGDAIGYNGSAGTKTLVIEGGIIKGQIYIQSGSVSVSGNPVMDKLDLTNGKTVTVGELTNGASIGVVTADINTAFTNTGVAAYADYFHSGYQDVYALSDGALALGDKICPHCNKAYSEITWVDWNAVDKTADLVASGAPELNNTDETYYSGGYRITGTDDIHYKLTADFANGSYGKPDGSSTTVYQNIVDLPVGKTVVVDLAGYTWEASSRRVFCIESGGVALLDSSVNKAGILCSKVLNNGNNAGVVYAEDGTVYTQYDGTIQRSAGSTKVAKHGGVIYSDGAAINILGGTVANGAAGDKDVNGYGGNIYAAGGTLTIRNAVVTGGTAQSRGGNIYATSSCNVTIEDSQVIDGTVVSGSGGNIYLLGSATLEAEDSKFIGGSSSGNGGNIYINDGESADFTNCEFKGGTCGSYGGIMFYTSCPVSFDGCTGVSGEAGAHPSTGYTTDGLYGASVLTIKDSSFEDITSTKTSDTGVIFIGSVECNFYRASAGVADISAMTDGNITVYGNAGAFTTALESDEAASAYLDNITSGDIGLSVKVRNGALVLAEGEVERYCPHCDKTVVFEPYLHDGNVDLVADAHYYLSEIVSTGSEVGIGISDDSSTPELETLPVDVVIDLNGKTLSCGNRAFTVRSGCSLFLMDSVGGAVLSGGYTSGSGACINALADAKVTLHSGTYTQNNSKTYTKNGGVITVNGGEVNVIGTAVVTGGTTSGNGGNIYATGGASVTIADNAIISGGEITANGGNIYATSNSVLNIKDNAKVTGGKALNGGNIYAPSGTALNMTGGTVENGTAYNDGVTITYGRGGNIYLGAAEHTISGGTISGGISEADDLTKVFGGGNIYVYEGGKLTVSGDATITGGSSGTKGGNIYTLGNLVLENAAISNGTAPNCGADIYIGDTGAIEIALAVTGDLGIGINDNKYEGSAPYGKVILDSVYSGTDMNSELKLTLDGVRGNVPVYAQGGALWVQDGGVAVVDIDGNCEYFANPADAVAAFDQSTDMWLMACGADEIVLTKDAWIDVNGCDFTVSGDYTASFIDSSNDDYESFGWVTLNGASLGNGNSVAANTTTYYTVKGEDGRYSFHLLDMEITAVSLKTKTGGLYYEAKWYCDDTMKGQIDTFGIAANLGSMPTELVENQFSWMNGTELVSGKAYVGATINGIIGTDEIKDADGNVISNDVRGAMKLYAAPYVWLKNGDVVMADTEVGMSLKDCCDAIDGMITELLDGDADDKALAADYISYMNDYLFGDAWKDLGLTWTFTNFQKAESAEA